MIGNRVATPTATQVLIICSATVGVVDRCVIDHMALTNASGSAISLANATNGQISYNNISSSGLSGIFLDTTGAGHRVLYNNLTDSNLQNIAGHGSIMARDGGVIGEQLNIQVVGNSVSQTTMGLGNAVGIGMNGVQNLLVFGNKVMQTTGSGEGIAVTAKNARILANTTGSNAGFPAAGGILYYATANGYSDAEIGENIVRDGSPNIHILCAMNGITMANLDIHNNRAFGNSNYGIQSDFSGGVTGCTLSDFQIHDNTLLGNVLGPVNLRTRGVTGRYNLYRNRAAL